MFSPIVKQPNLKWKLRNQIAQKPVLKDSSKALKFYFINIIIL